MPGSLEAPLARALHDWEMRGADADAQIAEYSPGGLDIHDDVARAILAALRSDPAVTAALAEALHMELGDETCAYWDNKNDWDMVEHRKQAAAIADSLLGPRESAGGMEP